MHRFIDLLRETRILSTLDVIDGYWQIKVSEKARKKTTLTFQHGLYQFNKIPCGLEQATVTYQRVFEIIFWCLKERVIPHLLGQYNSIF